MALSPEAQAYLREVVRLLYLAPLEKARVVRELAARIEQAAAERGLDGVRDSLGEPRYLAAETMLGLAESGRQPMRWAFAGQWRPDFEYKSRATLYNWPLLHIATGYDVEKGRPRVAKGIVAIGSVAIGAFAIGGVSLGLISLGGLAVGFGAALGGMAIGGWGALGGIAVAAQFAVGSLVIAGRAAMGALAVGPAAAGGVAIGRDAVAEGATRAEFVAWLTRNMPLFKRIMPWL